MMQGIVHVQCTVPCDILFCHGSFQKSVFADDDRRKRGVMSCAQERDRREKEADNARVLQSSKVFDIPCW